MQRITAKELKEIQALELYAPIDQQKEDMIRKFGKKLIGNSAINCSLRFITGRILHKITGDNSYLDQNITWKKIIH